MGPLTSAQVMFYSMRSAADPIWVTGDSYPNGVSGSGTVFSLRTAGYTVAETADGGITEVDIAADIVANAALIRQCKLIVWDGRSPAPDAVAYTDTLAAALDVVGPNFVLIPMAVPYGATDAAEAVAVRDEFVRRWSSKVLDWRNYIPNTGGIINLDQMLNYPTDTAHLISAAHDLVVGGLISEGLI